MFFEMKEIEKYNTFGGKKMSVVRVEELDKLLRVLDEFLSAFELVFEDDWEFTQGCMEQSEYFISEDGTFINPRVEDEGNNWANRGSLLESYRELSKCMKECVIE